MIINDVNLKDLGCELLRYRITPSQYSGRGYWNNGSRSPVLVKGQYTFSNLEVDIYIEGINSADVEAKKSKLNAVMENPIIVLDEVDDSIEYLCSYENQVVIEKINEVVSLATYNFKTFKRGKIKSVPLTNTTNTVDIISDVETEVIYEITPTSDIIDFTINDITIKNLKANKTIIVDGIKKAVTVDGENKFNDTDFWAFPTVLPGTNKITLSRSNVDVVLKYHPRYV